MFFKKSTLVVVLALCSIMAHAQTWTQSQYSYNTVTTTNYILGSFTGSAGITYNWTVTENNWVYVTGASTSSPPWDSPFTPLQYNNYYFTRSFSATPTVPGTFYNCEDYFASWGIEGWQETNSDGTVTTATRSESTFWTDSLYYTFVPTGTGGGSGSGS